MTEAEFKAAYPNLKAEHYAFIKRTMLLVANPDDYRRAIHQMFKGNHIAMFEHCEECLEIVNTTGGLVDENHVRRTRQ